MGVVPPRDPDIPAALLFPPPRKNHPPSHLKSPSFGRRYQPHVRQASVALTRRKIGACGLVRKEALWRIGEAQLPVAALGTSPDPIATGRLKGMKRVASK